LVNAEALTRGMSFHSVIGLSQRQCRWPSVLPELLRLVKLGKKNNCQQAVRSRRLIRGQRATVSRKVARGQFTAARQQKRGMTLGKTDDVEKDQ